MYMYMESLFLPKQALCDQDACRHSHSHGKGRYTPSPAHRTPTTPKHKQNRTIDLSLWLHMAQALTTHLAPANLSWTTRAIKQQGMRAAAMAFRWTEGFTSRWNLRLSSLSYTTTSLAARRRYAADIVPNEISENSVHVAEKGGANYRWKRDGKRLSL